MSKVSVEHRGAGFVVLNGVGSDPAETVTVAIDPWLATEGKGRRRRSASPATAGFDFVVVSGDSAQSFDDALDAIEGSEAVLIGTPRQCDEAARELGGAPEGYMDLEVGESARCGWFQVTAFGLEGSTSLPGVGDVASSVSGLGRSFGVRAEPPMQLTEMLGRLPFLSSLPSLGFDHRARRGYLLAFAEGPSILLAGGAFTGKPNLALLDEVSDLPRVDVVIAAAEGNDVAGLVWAVRELEPTTLILVRNHDPYSLDARHPSLPIRRFIEAVEEDSPDTEIIFMRKGASHVLGA